MSKMLFDNIPHEFKGPIGHTEHLFDYLNRSARPSITRVRTLLEDWTSRYPKENDTDFRTRFRSPDDIHHKAAFFELYIHELLLRLGFQVEAHPIIPNAPTHPEFLVYRGGIPTFYIEATLAAGPTEETATDKRKNVVYETIDKLQSPNFFIGIKVESSSTIAPSGRKWRSFLEKWLSEIDPDAIIEKQRSEGLGDLPNITLEQDGWKVNFHAIPKSPNARGKPGVRPIGLHFFPFHECKEDDWVRNAIKEKATKYGKLKLPYVIAINVLSIFINDDQMIMDALFGDEQITSYYMPGGKSKDILTRAPNGAFRGLKGPKNSRVSGIIVCNDLLWCNIAKIDPVFWHNPWASYPFDPGQWPLPQWILNTEKTRIVPKMGQNAGDLFGFPKDWPIFNNEKDIE